MSKHIITPAWIDKHNVCSEGKARLNSIKPNWKRIGYRKLIDLCFEHSEPCYANWLIVELLNDRQRAEYALYAAMDCEHYYNEECPNDDRVHKCNQVRRDYLDGKATLEELEYARSVAWKVAWLIGWRSTGLSAEASACSAAWSANLTFTKESARSSARLAVRSIMGSAALEAAREAAMRKYVDFGIKLFEEGLYE